MNIYVDESIHDQYGFMLLAYVICEYDPQKELKDIINESGVIEFHACEKMQNNPAMQKLRSRMRWYIHSNCEWGVMVLPNTARTIIKDDLLELVNGLAKLFGDKPLKMFIDECIITDSAAAEIKQATKLNSVNICNSRSVFGIQLADLVAALCGVRLREEISGDPKMLTYGKESGYDRPIKAELGFELWASLRYSMMANSVPKGEEMPEMASFQTEGYGLFLSPNCSDELGSQARKIFGEIYLGCIH